MSIYGCTEKTSGALFGKECARGRLILYGQMHPSFCICMKWLALGHNKNENLWLLGPNPKGWGPIDLRCPSIRLFVIDSFRGCICVTDGCRDLGTDSYEISWCLDVPLTVLARFDHRKWLNLAKMSKNSGFSKHELFPGCFTVTDGQTKPGIRLKKGLGV